jgi:hypothetical protein
MLPEIRIALAKAQMEARLLEAESKQLDREAQSHIGTEQRATTGHAVNPLRWLLARHREQRM